MQEDHPWKPLAAVIGVLAAIAFGAIQQQRLNTPPEDDWFIGSVIEYPGVVVVKFGAEWCGPCRSMHRELSQLKRQHIGGLKVVEVDIDQKPQLAEHYGVGCIPHTLLFVNGRYQTGITGSRSADELQDWVRPYLDQRVAATQ